MKTPGMKTAEYIAILPIGATEQHGPHLPFETDALIAAGVATRLQQALGTQDKYIFLPVEKIGYSPEHLDYGGTQSLSYNAAIERWIGIGESVLAQGIHKIILLNAHGGNSPLLTIVATELRIRHAMLAVATSWTRMGVPDDLFSSDEQAYGIHGGDIETSVMMALHPELIAMNAALDFPNFQQELAKTNTYLRAYGKHAFGWKIQDLNPGGALGNAANASVEKGEKLLQHSVKGLVKLVEEVAQFDLQHFEPGDKYHH